MHHPTQIWAMPRWRGVWAAVLVALALLLPSGFAEARMATGALAHLQVMATTVVPARTVCRWVTRKRNGKVRRVRRCREVNQPKPNKPNATQNQNKPNNQGPTDTVDGPKPTQNQNKPNNQGPSETVDGPKPTQNQNKPNNQGPTDTVDGPKPSQNPDKPDNQGPTGNVDGPPPPKNDDVAQDRPDRLVCINGRVSARRCQCRPGDRPRRARPGVVVCGASGTAAMPPVLQSNVPGAASPGSSPPPVVASPTPASPDAASATVVANRPDFVADEVLVTVPLASAETVDAAVAADFGVELIERLSLDLLQLRLVRYRIDDGRSVQAVIAAMQADPRVGGPQPNYYYFGEAGPEGLGDLQYALAMVEAPSAHTLARGAGVAVAVIDAAVDATHPDLAGVSIDIYDPLGDPDGALDGGSHGTAIAGIIAARGALAGVAPDSRLLSARAFTLDGEGGLARGTTVDIIESIDWSVGEQARVINMSFAGPRDPLMEEGIDAAARQGVILVAAAGNAGAEAPPAYPAAYDAVIAVTAVDIADKLYADANRGTYVDIAAPGVDVLVLAGEHAHALQTGTSFAAAHVSGILALMLERDPDLTAVAARDALKQSAEDLGTPGWDTEFGAGRANARLALGEGAAP